MCLLLQRQVVERLNKGDSGLIEGLIGASAHPAVCLQDVKILYLNIFNQHTTIIPEKQRLCLFYVFLTVHLRMYLVSDQLDAQFFICRVYLDPIHVSSNLVLILSRTIVLIQHLV